MQDNNKKIARNIEISSDKLDADLVIPAGANSIILFAHGSGSSRHSTRNQYVSQVLNDAGFATLLVDLLTQQEKEIDEKTRHLRFNIDLLAKRLLAVTQWLVQEPETKELKIGYFGSSTGAAAALIATAALNETVKAIVCRGGRLDLTESAGVLHNITAPTLLVVGSNDSPLIIGVNGSALKQLTRAEAKDLVIIPDASHLFEESGKMEEVAEVATEWFECHLSKSGRQFTNRYQRVKTPRLRSILKRSTFQFRLKSREAAGELLASLLSKYKNKEHDTIVTGIPRGGVIIADIVARKLNADFDVIVPRKLRGPNNSEGAIGAVMPDGSLYLNVDLVESMKVSKEFIEMEKAEQEKEIKRRMNLYRPEPKEYKIKGRTVILVDDGAATGATIAVAARWIRRQNPKKLVIAVPIVSKEALEVMKKEADSTEVLRSPSEFRAVEQFYIDFNAVSDEQIIEICKRYSTF